MTKLKTKLLKDLPIKTTPITDEDYVVNTNHGTTRLKVKDITENLDQQVDKLTSDVKEILEKGTTVETIKNATEKEIQKQLSNGNLTHMVIANNSIGLEKMKDIAIQELSDVVNTTMESTLVNSEILERGEVNLLTGMENRSFARFEPSKASHVWNINYEEGVYPATLEQPILEHHYTTDTNGLHYVGLVVDKPYTKGLISYGLWINTADLRTIKNDTPNTKFDILLICEGGNRPNHQINFTLEDLAREGTIKKSSNMYFTDMTLEVVSVQGDWSYIRTYVDFAGHSEHTFSKTKWYFRCVNYGPCSTSHKVRTQGNVVLYGNIVKPYKLYTDVLDRQILDKTTAEGVIDERINDYNVGNTVTNYIMQLYEGVLGNPTQSSSFTTAYMGHDKTIDIYPTEEAPVWKFGFDSSKSQDIYAYLGYSIPIDTTVDNKYYISCWVNRSDIEKMPEGTYWCFTLGGVADSAFLTKEELLLNKQHKTKVLADNNSVGITMTRRKDWVFIVGEFTLNTFKSTQGAFYFKFGYTSTPDTRMSFSLKTVGHTLMAKCQPFSRRLYNYRIATVGDVEKTNLRSMTDHLKMYHWNNNKPEWNNAIRHIYNTDITPGYNKSIFSDTDVLNNSTVEYIVDENSTTYGVSNSIRLTGTCKTSKYAPQLSFFASADDLALIGVVPNDDAPPTISMRGLISKLDYKENIANMQVFMCLRYGDTANIGTWKPSKEVTFVNSTTTATGHALGGQNPLFSGKHIAKTINNSNIFGCVHEGIPVPQTVDGLPFMGVVIRLYGYINEPQPGKQLCLTGLLPTVSKGSNMDTFGIYSNLPEDFSLYNGSEDTPKPTVTSKTVSLDTVDRITLLGNSYSASHYTMKDKAYINILSALSDYNWENYSRSGDTVLNIESRVQHGVNDYGLPFKDFKTTYGLILEYTNSGKHRAFDGFYMDNLDKLMRTIEGMGVKPILATEFLMDKKSDLFGMKDVADRHNAMFIDVYTKASLFGSRQNGSNYRPFWGNGHPATRNNTLLYHELLKRLNTLPRPTSSIKIFRKRKGTPDSLINLNYDTHHERMQYWKELSVGHHYLNNPQYYDALNVNSACGMKVQSEYLQLMQKNAISFNKYALIEVVMPSTADNIKNAKLVLKGTPGLRVWIKNFLHPTRSLTDHLLFQLSSSVSVGVGDVYSYNGVNYTVSGVYDNNIVTTTKISTNPNYKNGVLTKVSGVGPSSIAFSTTVKGFHMDYYNSLFKPKGKFEELSAVEDKYEIPSIKQYLDYDKFVFVIEKQGDFHLTDVYIEWEGEEGKVNFPKPEYQYFNGTELLAETKMGNSTQLGKWTTSSNISVKQPLDIRKPFAIDGIIELTEGQYIEQAFTFKANNYGTTEINISVWGRTFPEIFNPQLSYPDQAPITSDTYDFGEYEVSLTVNSSDKYTFIKPSCLDWVDEEIRTILPAGCTSGKIRITCKSKNLQLSKVSICSK